MSIVVGQEAFAAAVLDPTLPVPAGVVSYRGDADEKRFAVYRNNVHVGLVGVVAAKYPVCATLVGEEFFTANGNGGRQTFDSINLGMEF